MLDINGWTLDIYFEGINTGLSTLFTFELYSMYGLSRVLQKRQNPKNKENVGNIFQ